MSRALSGRYWRPAAFYFAHFAGLGILIPYWPVYLQARGYTPVEISTVMSCFVCSRLLAPYFWGLLADHYAKPVWVIRVTAVAALLSFCGVLAVSSSAVSAAATLLFGLFWSAPLPQVEALTLSSHSGASSAYGSIRLWGSVGYILSAGLLGICIDRIGADIVPGCFLFALLGICAASLMLQGSTVARDSTDAGSFWGIVQRRDVFVLLLVSFLMQLGHGPYYTFFTLYLQRYGYSNATVGELWASGVVAEVGMFLVIQTLIGRFGLRRMLLGALSAGVLRWSLLAGYAEYPAALVLVQLLHACTFGTFHAVTVQMIHYHFPGRYQGRGQALYSSLAYGAGGAIGAFASGYAWVELGANVSFFGASLVTLAALALGRWGLREPASARGGAAV